MDQSQLPINGGGCAERNECEGFAKMWANGRQGQDANPKALYDHLLESLKGVQLHHWIHRQLTPGQLGVNDPAHFRLAVVSNVALLCQHCLVALSCETSRGHHYQRFAQDLA